MASLASALESAGEAEQQLTRCRFVAAAQGGARLIAGVDPDPLVERAAGRRGDVVEGDASITFALASTVASSRTSQ